MIVFDLRCEEGHVFEAWFGSTGDYDAQKERGLVSCPLCGSPEVDKAVMAPNVSPKGNRAPVTVAGGAQGVVADHDAVKGMLAAMAAVQKKVLENSDYVGDRFADEARAIHLGEIEARSIYGKATPEQTETLLEEGIKVAPLPFPVIEPGQEN